MAAEERLPTVAAEALLGEASEENVAEVEAAIADAERDQRRWRAALRELDDALGIIRDSEGCRSEPDEGRVRWARSRNRSSGPGRARRARSPDVGAPGPPRCWRRSAPRWRDRADRGGDRRAAVAGALPVGSVLEDAAVYGSRGSTRSPSCSGCRPGVRRAGRSRTTSPVGERHGPAARRDAGRGRRVGSAPGSGPVGPPASDAEAPRSSRPGLRSVAGRSPQPICSASSTMIPSGPPT
jgi:hypothetical protein